ncbi:esterase/lipase/thioesterase domain-containing protein [Cavenderia fasciculata]|uniref:palmitoyl-protein hydrolase n=1 Tax=Cavenderia fasciculata TaxID=261658 RepID=F4PZX0_CACFS|nr:esterase/lipase/thioesterase domain-containing protein [Cavenderia fasciculata]EGG18884.1 esterase/lipase/thioesterase domain-containing protein [Cavenderia fasciculata]|eukprot:XP_004357346.1 esterase/lipase/thioesterase domain-containing protein [Cavenderia fasciculata]
MKSVVKLVELNAKRSYYSVVSKDAATKYSATVIFSHGLGDTGAGWSDLMLDIKEATNSEHIKFILPNAPIQPVTINMGFKMNSWYDIKSLTDRGDENKEEVEDSRSYIESLIKSEIDSGIPSERIMIAGFSQGAALSLYTFYTTSYKLNGCMVLSGYLPLSKRFKELIQPTNLQQPLIMFHGEDDQVVRHQWGKKSYEALQEASNNGINGKFISFPYMGHSSSPEEIKEMATFIKERLPKN